MQAYDVDKYLAGKQVDSRFDKFVQSLAMSNTG